MVITGGREVKILVVDVGGTSVKMHMEGFEVDGGNVHRLPTLPDGARRGDNDTLAGGIMLWSQPEDEYPRTNGGVG